MNQREPLPLFDRPAVATPGRSAAAGPPREPGVARKTSRRAGRPIAPLAATHAAHGPGEPRASAPTSAASGPAGVSAPIAAAAALGRIAAAAGTGWDRDPGTCWNCGRRAWWRSVEWPDVLRCGNCHPPAPGVAVEWLNRKEAS